MSKLNLIAIVSIVAAVSLIVGMAAPVFAQGNSLTRYGYSLNEFKGKNNTQRLCSLKESL
jgi:hypothetical protein